MEEFLGSKKTHNVEGYLNTEVNAKAMEFQKQFLAVEPPGAINYGIAENIDAFTQAHLLQFEKLGCCR